MNYEEEVRKEGQGEEEAARHEGKASGAEVQVTPPPPWFEYREFKSKLTGELCYEVKIGDNRWRRWHGKNVEQEEGGKRYGPACHDVNYYSNGEFKYNTHGRRDKGEQPCIEDLGNESARKYWHSYVTTTDNQGREIHGPAPFRNSAERAEYMKEFGFREKEPGQRYRYRLEELRDNLRRKHRR
jgi:hypothetical protein